MQTKPKANSVVTSAVDGSVITINVLGAGTVSLDTSACHAAIRDRAMIHGMIQRLSDRAAISRDPNTGKPATPADKLAAIRELVDHYAAGSDAWSLKRAGGGVRKSVDDMLAELTPENLVSKFSPEQLAAIVAAAQAQQDNATG